jgi:hypothetical protein
MKTRIYFTLLALALGASNVGAQQPAPTPTTKPKQTSPFKGEFVVTRTEDPVCIPLVKNLNEFRRHGFKECIPRVSKKYPQFKYPDWKEVPLDLEIAEKAFKGFSRFARNRELPARWPWQDWAIWLKDTEELRAKGQIRMWLAEVDVDNDGMVDTIARVERAHPALELPVSQRTCPSRHSGLWMVKGGSKEKEDHYNMRIGLVTDVVIDVSQPRTYTLQWVDFATTYFMDPLPKGQTGTVMVAYATAGGPGPLLGNVTTCNIAWVVPGAETKRAPSLQLNSRAASRQTVTK